MSSILRSSKFVRQLVGFARNIVISNRHEVDNTLLQRSQHLASMFSINFSSNTSTVQRGSSLERTIRRLDEEARRSGRISLKDVEEILDEMRHLRKVTISQSLMVIRCCGNLVPEETPERRTQLVEEIWNTLEKLGVSLDISHYNALLKVYLENEHKFSPTEFLAKLEKQGVEPNRVTYQRLISGYCLKGDIAGATKILEFMKEKQLPVSEGVFNALILGHSQADDMESAEGMLSVMKQASLEPSNETYTTLLCGYAKRGDKAGIDRLMTDCKVKDLLLTDKDILEVAYAAAISGHDELVDEILKNIRGMVGYNQDAANMLLRLITKGKDEIAYKVFLTMSQPLKQDNTPNMSGHLLIKQLVKTNKPIEKIVSICEKLEESGHTKYGVWLAVETSFYHGNIDLTLDLLHILKQKNEPIRNHYFWPSLITAGRAGNTTRLLDILKKMAYEFNVPATTETLKDCYLPFVRVTSANENLKSLMEAGVRRGQAVVALFSYLVTENRLKEAVELGLQHPKLNLRSIIMNRQLVDALQQTDDVKNVVALVHIITSNNESDIEGLEEDEETSTVEEFPGRFLSGVVAYSQTRHKITEVLKEMLERGLGISSSCAEIIESRLQGNQLTTEISDLLSKLSSGDLSPSALKRSSSGISIARDPVALERLKERMKVNNESHATIVSVVRNIFHAYYFQGNLVGALKTKQEWVEDLKQEMTPGWWAQLLDLYCSKDDLEGARECLENIKSLSQETELDGAKIVKMAKLYIQHNQIDEAFNLLKNVKPREEKNTYQARAACWQALSSLSELTKDPEQVKKLLQVLNEEKYIDINNINLGPVIKAYLLRDDLDGALKEFENCVNLYRATPWKNELAIKLIEKEDAVKLQTLVDLSTQIHGEINSLYDLVLSFVECGRIRQARKILETPGLSTRNNRLHTACERYKNEGKIAPLEGLVEATKDLPHIDRSEIYYNLLETYCQADNVEKAYGLWTQMQDEDVNVSDAFLSKLGCFLKSKGQHVPFEIPESVEIEEKNLETSKTKFSGQESRLLAAIKAGHIDEALRFKESIVKSGGQLRRIETTKLLEQLIERGRLQDATNLLISLQEIELPYPRAITFFLNKLSHAGAIDMMKQIGEHFSEDLKKMSSFCNRYMFCAVTAGKAKEELDKLEKEIDNTTLPEEVDTLALAFPRGGIIGVLESSPSYHEQVGRIVEKYYAKGVTIPANCLCMFYLGNGQFDKAKEIYERYNISNSSRLLFQTVLSKARSTSNPQLIEQLLTLIKDAPSMTPEMNGLIYSNMLNIYSVVSDAETTYAKLEEVLKITPIEHFHTNTLKRIKENLEAKNIPFKYTIPERKVKDSSSSSSSSSDADTKTSLASRH